MNPSELSVLIVEDELIATEYLKQILYQLDIHIIYEAKSANQAIQVARNNHIELVFMDINIQGSSDGIQCARELNKIDFIPIIFTTSYADKNTLAEAQDENLFGYVVKPFVQNDINIALMLALKQLKRGVCLDKQSQKVTDNTLLDLHDDYLYNLETKTLTHRNVPIKLTKKELELLDIFCHHCNENISYDYLRTTIWHQKDVSDSAIRDAVFRLKKKILCIDIQNISNYGYVLKV